MTYVIDPLSIATGGFLSSVDVISRSLTVATMGWIVEVSDELVSATGGKLDPSSFLNLTPKERESIKRRIRATVVIDGISYTDVVEISDLSLSLSDVRVQVNNTIPDSIPTIRILYPR